MKAEFHLLGKGESLANNMATAGICQALGGMKAGNTIFAGIHSSSGETKVPHRAGNKRLRRMG